MARRKRDNTWRNRITRHALVHPDELQPSPDNYRLHPVAQQDALEQLLAKVGWVGQVLVSERTGAILDGHLRVELAKQRGETQIPVVYVDLTPDEERLVLATYDPLSRMAELNHDALDRLLADLTDGDPELQSLLATLHHAPSLDPSHTTQIPLQPLAPREGEGEVGAAEADTEDQVPPLPAPELTYPSELPWDLPPLVPDRLATIPEPLHDQDVGEQPPTDPGIWGLWTQRAAFPATLNPQLTIPMWYGDPSRAERFWHAPEAEAETLVRRGHTTVLSPWFPLDPKTPRAVQLYQVFRARWCARYLQACGLAIIPDLTLCRTAPRDNPWWIIGLPHQLPALACYIPLLKRRADAEGYADALAIALEWLSPDQLLLYGPPVTQDVLDRLNPGCPVTVVQQVPPKRYERLTRRN